MNSTRALTIGMAVAALVLAALATPAAALAEDYDEGCDHDAGCARTLLAGCDVTQIHAHGHAPAPRDWVVTWTVDYDDPRVLDQRWRITYNSTPSFSFSASDIREGDIPYNVTLRVDGPDGLLAKSEIRCA